MIAPVLPRRATLFGLAAALALTSAAGGCMAGSAPAPQQQADRGARDHTIRGVVTFDPQDGASAGYRVQATVAEVANGATVSLIDAKTGNSVATSVSEAGGAFVLSFRDFLPVVGALYAIEAFKGLSVGGKPNRPGAPAARVRTLLFWEGGWKSLTNTTPGVGIRVSPATTAVAALASLKRSAGQNVDLPALIGKVSGAAFDERGTGLSQAADFAPVLGLVARALADDQDPVAAIAYDPAKGTYRLATRPVAVTGVEPAVPVPGGQVVVRGAGFDPDPGRSRFWFGQYPAATWSVAADRTSVSVAVPAQAFSAPFTLERPGGVSVTLHPFLRLKGTVGTLAGSATAAVKDGQGAAAGFDVVFGLVIDPRGTLYVVDIQNSPRVYRIRRVLADGTVTTFAGADTRCSDAQFAADPEPCSADGVGTAARFMQPENLAIDQTGATVYVSDERAGRIRKIDTATAQVTTLRAPDGSPLQFRQSTGVSVDAAGNVYVVEYSDRTVKKITPQGLVSTVVAALPTPSFGLRIQPDGSGGYISLYAQHRFGALAWTGSAYNVSALAGSGSAGNADGQGSAASFTYPVTLEIEPGGSLVIADSVNCRIRRITPAGAVTTVAGGPCDFMDGPIGQARFGIPYGIAVDRDSLYVADSGNHRIRVITP